MESPVSNLPLVDEARIKAVFDELEAMEIELDDDPLAFGPKALNAKVGGVRRLLTRCERIFLQVSYDMQLYKRMHKGALADFDLQMQNLIANDPDVRAGRNVRDRDAIATMKLRSAREKNMLLEVAIQDLEMVMTVIKAKRADLRDLQGRLRDQIKLCQEEIGLGSRWGSRPPAGTRTPDLDAAPRTSVTALESVQELVASEPSGEIHLQPGDASWMETPEGTPVEDSEDESTILANLAREAFKLNSDTEDDDEEDDSEEDPLPIEVASPPAGEKEASASLIEVSPQGEDIDIFAEDTPVGAPDAGLPVIPSVSTDADVDRLFDRLSTPEPKKSAILPPSTVDDLDSLIDMFGN